MTRASNAISIADMHEAARRYLPKIILDFVDGGYCDELGVERNRGEFQKHLLVPRYLRDIGSRDQSVTLFGHRYASPIGIAPTGMAGILRHGADDMLAAAAAKFDVPHVVSGGAGSPIERLVEIAGHRVWYQLYGARDPEITEAVIARTAAAGVETLVVTVDIPVPRKSERDIRNGFVRPYRPTVAASFEALRHPQWMWGYLRHGLPMFDTWARFAPKGSTPLQVAAFLSKHSPTPQTWDNLKRYRELWKGNFVVKGILHPADAVRCIDIGANGIWVSNHGARQLDHAPSPLAVLPKIRAAVSADFAVLMDSGIRRGTEVLISLARGADSTFFGRPTLYGVAAGGQAGVERVLSIVRSEVDLAMGQTGVSSLVEITPDLLADSVI